MQRSFDGENIVHDLEARFAVIEERVQTLVAENKSLRGRINNLEEKLAEAKRDARDLEQFHGDKVHIREKIERILQQLETVGGTK
jgi:chromosome segregation ATPase